MYDCFAEQGGKSPVIRVMGGCGSPCGCWESSPYLLQELYMVLITEPSLQLPNSLIPINYYRCAYLCRLSSKRTSISTIATQRQAYSKTNCSQLKHSLHFLLFSKYCQNKKDVLNIPITIVLSSFLNTFKSIFEKMLILL